MGSRVILAHQPDLSTIVLSKTPNGQIVLQVNSSLTAFQGEINYTNLKNPYKTPEEFKMLVIKHFLNTVLIRINNKDTLRFKTPIVILGHETKLISELIGMPQQINSIFLSSKFFKDVHNNQSAIIFLMEGFPTKKYILNNDNNHEMNISLKDGQWENVDIKDTIFNVRYFVWLFILMPIGVLMYYKFYKSTPVQE